MHKRLVILATVALTALVAGLVIVWRNESVTSPSSGEMSSVADAPIDVTGAGRYVAYSEAALAETQGVRILFFHASWCPQCRALEADIKKQGVPAGTTIFKVDYDNAQNLRRKYGVTLQTTVVKVDQNGNLLSIFTPYQKPTLENALSNL